MKPDGALDPPSGEADGDSSFMVGASMLMVIIELLFFEIGNPMLVVAMDRQASKSQKESAQLWTDPRRCPPYNWLRHVDDPKVLINLGYLFINNVHIPSWTTFNRLVATETSSGTCFCA